jgi:hypothetical protein
VFGARQATPLPPVLYEQYNFFSRAGPLRE